MLWYKAWRESRTRFVASALALAAICSTIVFFHRDVSIGMSDDEPLTYATYIWQIAYKGYVRDLFVLIAIFLGLGGLTRERDHRTTGFTLALPVSRFALLATRTVVGCAQVLLLAAVPAILVPALSALVGQRYPASQAWGFGVLWAMVGLLVHAIGILASVLFAGEFTAPIAACFGLIAYSLLADMSGPGRYLTDIHDVMSGIGMPHFTERIGMLTGPLPWSTLLVVLLGAVTLVALGALITNRQDF